MAIEWTDETALARARELAPIYGLREDQLPTTVFSMILNGLQECEAFLAAMPQQETPSPIVQVVPEWVP